MVFLGRIAPEKGPDVAARWAKTAGRPLRIAAKIPGAQNSYFKERVSPYLDDPIRFVGEVDERGKRDLLGSAAALSADLVSEKWRNSTSAFTAIRHRFKTSGREPEPRYNVSSLLSGN